MNDALILKLKKLLALAGNNPSQQEAIAKAYGMQAEEMADMLYKAKVLDKVGGQTLKNLRERANVLHEQGKETEAINLRNTIAQLEQGILSGKTLEQGYQIECLEGSPDPTSTYEVLQATLTVEGRDSGARLTIPVTVTKVS